ncbi:MAG: S41 family peptidase [Bacteroidales bacterium]
MNKNPKSLIYLPLLIAITLVIGMYIGNGDKQTNINPFNQEYSKIDRILNLVSKGYVDSVNVDSIVELTIPEMLSKLDPHTTYIPAKDLTITNDELNGSFFGIGISFMILNDTINVVEIISGGPSEKIGLLAGDKIVTINDSTVTGEKATNDLVMKNLRGKENTKVKVGIKRSTSDKLLSFEITRGEIPLNSVDASYMIDEQTGYIKVNKFGITTYKEFITGLTKLKYDGAKRYIVDLRGNGGGFMEASIVMANEFLPSNNSIVMTKGRDVSNNRNILSDGNGSFTNEDVIILIDEFSASASEILAGAIQDNDRGLIVGRRSFGKGLVQQQLELPDSSAIRLTVARYYTPSGRCIQKEYNTGNGYDYSNDILERYNHGEFMTKDSIKFNEEYIYQTAHGRTVYGGGGIMPDIFVPSDTMGVTSYYLDVLNKGLLQKFAFRFTELNRDKLKDIKTYDQFLEQKPSDRTLLLML